MGCNCGKSRATRKAILDGRAPRAAGGYEYCVKLPKGGEECFLVLHEARRFAKKKGLKKPVPRRVVK